MKGKKILTLLSIFAGAAVVGTTFAAWAVTDNADPFGIKVSPGAIRPEGNTFVTLSYGESTFANVDNLEIGVPRLAGSIKLVADVSDKTAYTGVFQIKLEDRTTGRSSESAPKLIEHLTVDVYDGPVTISETGVVTSTGSKIGTVPTTGDTPFVNNILVTVPANSSEKQVYVVVSLADATPEAYAQFISDVVYIGMDWNKNTSYEELTTSKIFLKMSTEKSGKDIYCYAWESGTKMNKAYPGDKMEDLGLGIYSYDLAVNYKGLKFVEEVSEGNYVEITPSDVTIPTADLGTTPCYDVTLATPGWASAPEIPTLSHDYYISSLSKGNWKPDDLYGLTRVTDSHYTGEMTFTAGEEIKAVNKAGNVWYGCESTYDFCNYTLENGNVKVTDGGTYTVDLYTDSAQHNYITLAKK